MLLKNSKGDADHFLIFCFIIISVSKRAWWKFTRIWKWASTMALGVLITGAVRSGKIRSLTLRFVLLQWFVPFSCLHENCGVLYVSIGQPSAIWKVVRDLHKYVIFFRYRSDFRSLAGYDDDTTSLAQQPTAWLHEDGYNRASHIWRMPSRA